VVGFTPDNKALWITTSLDVNAARLLEIDVGSGKQKVIAYAVAVYSVGPFEPRARNEGIVLWVLFLLV
jgi:hypothetical protein